MARSNNNIVTHGLSGKVGDLLVFRQRHGKTVVTKVPVKSGSTSEGQKEVRQKFTRAVVYAKSVAANADLKKLYEAKAVAGQTAFNLALADFCTPPEIHSIDPTGYTGAVGNLIRVQATDDFLVKQVEVVITAPDGTDLEKGLALLDADGLSWSYTVTQANASVTGSKITVSAKDNPGNLTVFEKVLSQD